jgi:hypothetical protein
MSFTFVENATIQNEKSRKLIRSHCMIGKNAGKTRARKRSVQSTYALQPRRKDLDNDVTTIVGIQSVFGDRFATVCFPCRLNPRMHDLLYRCESPHSTDIKLLFTHIVLVQTNQILYPEQFCLPKSVRDNLWFPFLVNDEACMKTFTRCALASY